MPSLFKSSYSFVNYSMQLRAFKYLSPLLLYFLAWVAFTGKGWITYPNASALQKTLPRKVMAP